MPGVFLLAGHTEPQWRAAGREDHGLATEDVSGGASGDALVAIGIHFQNFLHFDLESELAGVLGELHAELGSGNVLETKIVLYLTGHGDLAARQILLQADSLPSRPRGVQAGAQAARSAADYDHIVLFLDPHVCSLLVAWPVRTHRRPGSHATDCPILDFLAVKKD